MNEYLVRVGAFIDCDAEAAGSIRSEVIRLLQLDPWIGRPRYVEDGDPMPYFELLVQDLSPGMAALTGAVMVRGAYFEAMRIHECGFQLVHEEYLWASLQPAA